MVLARTPDASTCHDLCFAYSDDHGKTWLNKDGQEIGRTGASYITADSQGVAVWKIPPSTKHVNGGTMTVDHTSRVHVLDWQRKHVASYRTNRQMPQAQDLYKCNTVFLSFSCRC